MKNITVIGEGTMTKGIHHNFEQSSFSVKLNDTHEAASKRQKFIN